MKIFVKVKFEKSKEDVIQTGENEYTVYVKSAPIAGKANEEVIRKITKHLKVKQAKIISGKSFFKKTILIID